MKQPHTESTIRHDEGEQNTGNHRKPGTGPGPDELGGTRAGAENVEKRAPDEPDEVSRRPG